MDWFLYDNGLRHVVVNVFLANLRITPFEKYTQNPFKR